jgi:hypothetical protein
MRLRQQTRSVSPRVRNDRWEAGRENRSGGRVNLLLTECNKFLKKPRLENVQNKGIFSSGNVRCKIGEESGAFPTCQTLCDLESSHYLWRIAILQFMEIDVPLLLACIAILRLAETSHRRFASIQDSRHCLLRSADGTGCGQPS